ncbi:C40 family peptidase [Streptomyces sp. TP-A0874]|uniref:C40 family peptidase n=1 Tax=Streptomyces sp. TP-A0874 TaxID=549819 RepID=UPI00085385A0|nr:peptidoglycan-binding protein [Streptomyces sp. TP-A0874]
MSLRSRVSRRARLALASVAAGGLAVAGIALVPSSATATTTTSTSRAAAVQTQADTITPAEMLRRAATWLTANNGSQVPYSQTSVWSDGYRQDCSGYVSMTLGLWKSGPNTVELASNRSLTTPISLGDLKPGDLLIDAEGSNTTRHVVIFEKWTDSSHTAYSAFEQRGGHGTDHRVLTYGLNAGSEYKPYRPVKLSGETPPDPPAADWPMLTVGSQGANVTTAQYLLRAQGQSLVVDGSYGSETAARAKAFQSAKGLVADGEIGPKTWPHLVVEVKNGSQGDAVRALQTQLVSHGYKVTVDGSFGPETQKAVTDFQGSKKLVVDGLVGPVTWEALL